MIHDSLILSFMVLTILSVSSFVLAECKLLGLFANWVTE